MSDANTSGAPAGASGATGAAAAAAAATTTTTTAQTSTPPDWTTSLNDEMKGYVQTKGFKAPQDVLESYRNFEKLQGVPQDRILKLPESIDLGTPEGRAIFERLGAPKEAKDYNIEIPKEHGDAKLADWFRDVAHKNGFTKKQAESLVASWNETSAAQMKAFADEQKANFTIQEQTLKTEWGHAYEQNVNIAKSGTQALGLNKDQVAALEGTLGFDGVMKLLHKFGSATGEHQFVTGNGAGPALDTNSAKQKISALMQDKGWYQRFNAGDREAKAEWDKLHKFAYPGTTTI